MEDLGPPDLLEFLTEANLLPPAVYLQLQNRDLDGNATESDTLISLGLIDATRLAQLQAERLGKGYIDLILFPTEPRFAQNSWAGHSPADGRVALAHERRCDSHLNRSARTF
jgi:hypothetical protein